MSIQQYGIQFPILLQIESPRGKVELVETIGKGNYGYVYKGKLTDTQEMTAVKVVYLKEDELRETLLEMEILRACNHKNITRFMGLFLKGLDLWICMELCTGGALDSMYRAICKNFNEDQISSILYDTLVGLDYLHSKVGLIHRDIKAGNILLSEEGECKLADFGVSAKLNKIGGRARTFIGTPYWMAPEVIATDPQRNNSRASYDCKADIWSIGITAIEIAEKNPPLSDIHPMRALQLIPNQNLYFARPKNWSKVFQDFVTQCLDRNPETRPSASALLNHPFLARSSTLPRATIVSDLVRKARIAREKRKQGYSDWNDSDDDDNINNEKKHNVPQNIINETMSLARQAQKQYQQGPNVPLPQAPLPSLPSIPSSPVNDNPSQIPNSFGISAIPIAKPKLGNSLNNSGQTIVSSSQDNLDPNISLAQLEGQKSSTKPAQVPITSSVPNAQKSHPPPHALHQYQPSNNSVSNNKKQDSSFGISSLSLQTSQYTIPGTSQSTFAFNAASKGVYAYDVQPLLETINNDTSPTRPGSQSSTRSYIPMNGRILESQAICAIPYNEVTTSDVLDDRYILIGTDRGLYFIDLYVASMDSSGTNHAMIPLIRGTRFKQIEIINDLNIMVALAGKHDHIRQYKLNSIRKLILYIQGLPLQEIAAKEAEWRLKITQLKQIQDARKRQQIDKGLVSTPKQKFFNNINENNDILGSYGDLQNDNGSNFSVSGSMNEDDESLLIAKWTSDYIKIVGTKDSKGFLLTKTENSIFLGVTFKLDITLFEWAREPYNKFMKTKEFWLPEAPKFVELLDDGITVTEIMLGYSGEANMVNVETSKVSEIVVHKNIKQATPSKSRWQSFKQIPFSEAKRKKLFSNLNTATVNRAMAVQGSTNSNLKFPRFFLGTYYNTTRVVDVLGQSLTGAGVGGAWQEGVSWNDAPSELILIPFDLVICVSKNGVEVVDWRTGNCLQSLLLPLESIKDTSVRLLSSSTTWVSLANVSPISHQHNVSTAITDGPPGAYGEFANIGGPIKPSVNSNDLFSGSGYAQNIVIAVDRKKKGTIIYSLRLRRSLGKALSSLSADVANNVVTRN